MPNRASDAAHAVIVSSQITGLDIEAARYHRVGGRHASDPQVSGWSRPPYDSSLLLYIAPHNDSASRISSLHPPIPAIRRTPMEAAGRLG